MSRLAAVSTAVVKVRVSRNFVRSRILTIVEWGRRHSPVLSRLTAVQNSGAAGVVLSPSGRRWPARSASPPGRSLKKGPDEGALAPILLLARNATRNLASSDHV